MKNTNKVRKVLFHVTTVLIISSIAVFIANSDDIKYGLNIYGNNVKESISTAGINPQLHPKTQGSNFTKTDSVPKKRNCATVEYNEMMKEKYPQFRKNQENLEKDIQRLTETYDKSRRNVVTIPTVVHVVYNTSVQNISDAQVQTQIDVLNEDFRRLNSDTIYTPAPFKHLGADVEIEFCLARRDPNNNPTNGITRTFTNITLFKINNVVKFSALGGHDIWDRDKYLNIWVCNLGDNDTLGFAQFPGGLSSTDGVVIGYL